ncbi:hypothetical protein CB0940_09450 [Cercospora beticola]|uniref:ORC6 first cyclin-like domain-containing protein n=1 Tax=Cercospora beticola TaxID=122368 RepID=A0A2G5HJK2_CERBT|nr:hypothetical protein CB0940_09450 [Cercospora beticola]PIA92402.1 hypothetical protein CB0940_09450 [Cercospora beticola]WPB06235.1 hypothetical protein RHO25_010892 [Cercospora beticola]
MPTPTETVLSTLLPTISFLPPDLVSLASSLLAQSRSKAASLKPEEEIGRVYACAHIAAERLKKRLDLELDKPKPPCPPKVYKKLYGYLDGALSAPVPPPRTPRGERRRDVVGGNGSVGRSTPQQQSGRRGEADSATKLKTPSVSGMKRAREVVEKGQGQDVGQEIDGVPNFVMPLVRHVCKATKTPKAVPHVVVGAKAVVREIASRVTKRASSVEPATKRRRRTPQSAAKRTQTAAVAAEAENAEDAVAVEKWPALVVALLLYAVARMRGVEADSEEISDVRKEACEAVEMYVISNAASLPQELGDITMRSLKKPVDFYMLEAEDCGWLDMDWYRNVPENIDEVEQQDEDVEMGEGEEEETVTPRKRPTKTPLRRKEKHGGKAALPADGFLEDDLGAAGLLPGLGTMFQPAIDWLSDERRADYAKWKKGILKECATIEARA